jgi:hypothetical protein
MTPLAQPGSVVLAVYRPDLALLERQVRSLQHQEVRDWRCIVGIDGYDPKTHRRLLDLVGEDSRFSVHHFDDNLGVYRHFERLLALVPTGEVGWVALADQDDDWHPTKFSVLLPLLATHGVAAVVGRARVVADGREIGMTKRRVGGFASTLLINHVTGSLSIFRSDVVVASLPFPPASQNAIHDHWLAVCAAARGRIAQSDYVVQDYVQHSGNVIGDSRRHTLSDALRAMRAEGGPLRLVDQYGGSRWAWRVQMARTSLERQVPAEAESLAEAVAAGRLAPVTARAALRGVARREVTLIEGVALLAAAARWRGTAGADDRG